MDPLSFGAISGGKGGLSADLSAGPATGQAENYGGTSGGQTINMQPPLSLQQKAISTPVVMAGLGVAALWLYYRNK